MDDMPKPRYQVGFDEGTRCALADDNPDLIPIVDSHGEWLVGFAIGESDAERMVRALNALHWSEVMLNAPELKQ